MDTMSNHDINTEHQISVKTSTLSRRSALKGAAALSALSLAACNASATGPIAIIAGGTGGNVRPTGSGQHPIFGSDSLTRQNAALNLRIDAAMAQSNVDNGTQQTNGDEGLYADYRGSYSKALPHNDMGEVDTTAFQTFLDALSSGNSSDFEAIPLGGTRRLVSPQAAYRFEMVGLDSHSTFMRPAPAFASAETAAEMGEVYWKSLCRDVPFSDFDTSNLIQDAITDLNAFSETVGPQDNGSVTTGTVFRGDTQGDLTGPYLSQFLWQDIPYGNHTIVQQYNTPAPGDDFMTDPASWISVQRGIDPTPLTKGNPRYISDARALGEYVHLDFSYQAYMNAALIMLGIPNSADIANAYNTSVTQEGFVTFGLPDVLDMVSKAANLAFTGAWYQKWLVHRRARPEVYAGRLHFQKTGAKDYGLPAEIADSDAVARIFAAHGTYLLPMAFPEGSPTHPAYPAGHATVAGACTTVLKAYFQESLEIPNPVMANATGSQLVPFIGNLTLGGEINKLAYNIALGRDWAGVHYRSDGKDGILVGEQQAIGLLQNYSRTYNEEFDGFTLTKFDGQTIRIQNGVVI